MKSPFCILVHCLVIVFSLNPSWAQSQNKQTLFVVGVENTEYFPLYSNDAMNEYRGYARELLDQFAKSRGYRLTYRILPVKRLYAEFFNKDHSDPIDFKFPDSPDWKSHKREGYSIHYTTTILNYIDGVVVLPKHVGNGIKGIRRLGTVRGFTPYAYLNALEQKKLTLLENNTFTGLLDKVLLGRIDGAYINIDVANYQLRHIIKRPGELVFDPDLPHTKGGYMLSSYKHPEVIQEFNQFLIEQASFVEQLKSRYEIHN